MDAELVTTAIQGFDEQLSALYAEKELLEKELGVSSAEDIIVMIRSLEEQLKALYAEAQA
jgi:hypothetical protein